MISLRNLLVIGWLLLFPLAVHAYIGPGMGVGVIGVVLGILVAIFLAFFAILWYPVKRLFVRRRNQKEEKPGDSENNKKDSR